MNVDSNNKLNENEDENNSKNDISGNHNFYDDENYVPVSINKICDAISKSLQGLLKKFLLYVIIPPRFKEAIKNMEVLSLNDMQKKYNKSVTKEIEKEMEKNPGKINMYIIYIIIKYININIDILNTFYYNYL